MDDNYISYLLYQFFFYIILFIIGNIIFIILSIFVFLICGQIYFEWWTRSFYKRFKKENWNRPEWESIIDDKGYVNHPKFMEKDIKSMEDCTYQVIMNKDFNPQEKETIIFYHGFPDTPLLFTYQLHYFIKKNYNVLAPPCRGYQKGYLEEKDYMKFANVLEWGTEVEKMMIQCKLDKLSKPKNVHIVGHDWGSQMAQMAVLKNPDWFKSCTLLSISDGDSFQDTYMSNWKSMQWFYFYYVVLFNIPGVPSLLVSTLIAETNRPDCKTYLENRGNVGMHLYAPYFAFTKNIIKGISQKWKGTYKRKPELKCQIPTQSIWGIWDMAITFDAVNQINEPSLKKEKRRLVLVDSMHHVTYERPYEVNKAIEE